MTIARVIKPGANPSTGDAWLDKEASVQDSEPRELVTITHGTVTYRHTSATRDIRHGGQLYTSIATARGEIGSIGSGMSDKECTITLPIDHPLCRRYPQMLSPPKRISVTMTRLQGALAEVQWRGVVKTMGVNDDGTEGIFYVRTRIGEELLKVIPSRNVGRECPHSVYDAGCRVNPNGSNPDGHPFKCSTTVQQVTNGREVRLDLSNVPANYAHRAAWLKRGKLRHVASGEEMIIYSQADTSPGVSTVTVVTMQAPIVGLKVGDAIETLAGCALDIATCEGKFGARQNFGGMPQLPIREPFDPSKPGED